MLITSARTTSHPHGCNLQIVDGRVATVTPPQAVDGSYDVAGRVVLPAFVDAHVHLDKAFLLTDPPATTLAAALDSVAALRPQTSLDTIRLNARRAMDALVRNGTTAARAHVEIDLGSGLDLLTLHQELTIDQLTLQLVAFPQSGLEAAGMADLMAAAMAQGAEVVGGCPYVDSDPIAHLDTVFALAELWSAPVDLHLDFADDAAGSLIGPVVERTVAHGMAGRVTIGHVTTLAGMGQTDQQRSLDSLAGAGISLVILPATDLYLMGRGEPGLRSIAPYEKAVAAGVRTAIANNNIANAFAPFGNASLLHAAWLAGLIRRTASRADRAALLATITHAPAAILGLHRHGTELGDAADLAVLDCDDVDLALLQAPAVAATVKRGQRLPAWAPVPLF